MSRARRKKEEMNGNSLGVLPPGALAGAERSEGERSEPQRSAAAAKAGADSPLTSRPDPEVVAKPKRRTYTAEYKPRILAEAEAAAAIPGGGGALLRREGLYSSLLVYWRRERADGIREALTPRKRGRKSKRNPMEEEVQKLRRQNAHLSEDLRKAHIMIEVQKKVAALRGNPIPEPDPPTPRRNPDGRRHRTSERRWPQRCLPGSVYASRFLLPGSRRKTSFPAVTASRAFEGSLFRDKAEDYRGIIACGTRQVNGLCHNCASIVGLHVIGVSFERKADSPNS